MGRRRSANIGPPVRQHGGTSELLGHSDHSEEEENLIKFETPSHAASLVPSRRGAFAIGLFTGLGIAVGVLLLLRRYINAANEYHPKSEDLQILTPPGYTPRHFAPSETFKLGADNSNEAWRSIMPEGLGFVQHPDLGVEIVGLAFAHQLHCLDKLRQALSPNHSKPPAAKHLSHCLEYLRHSILCSADANLEYRKEDPVTGRLETPGDGVHLCRGSGELFYFAEKWRVYDGKTLREKRRRTEEELGRKVDFEYVSSRGDEMPHG